MVNIFFLSKKRKKEHLNGLVYIVMVFWKSIRGQEEVSCFLYFRMKEPQFFNQNNINSSILNCIKFNIFILYVI